GENSSQKLLRRFYINLNRRTVVNDSTSNSKQGGEELVHQISKFAPTLLCTFPIVEE
ncbi:5050_t:CDS:1, partial [Funneliformis caledonium]